ncbi:MAG: hypothetical protein MJZ22_06050, partial [Candidatus Saccharibacteria bacterium]|nr:hypothetical protein [Candidatus Saccharibacteria bacterium]
KEFISKYEMDSGMEKETNAPTAPDDTTNIGENWDYSIGDADAENQRLGEQYQEKRAKLFDKFPEAKNKEPSDVIDRESAKGGQKDDDVKDEIAGNIPKLVVDNKIDSFNKPKELFEYMEKKRGFKIDEKLKDFDFEKVKGVLKGIDSAMEVFPEAKIDSLRHVTKENFSASARYRKIPDSPFFIDINKKYFGKQSEPFRDSALHPKNRNAFSIAAHEMGHIINYAMARMESANFYNHYEDIAKSIVNKAALDSGIKNDYESILKFRSTISEYADNTYKYTETIAEAISDVFNNRSKASTASKAVYKSLMERLNNLRKNKR